ncbi:MAG TPA: DinB family protein [Thermoanaerobaculia bacterium]|nr:DinB family protein [Thermoanaerobaculia bacterium]
MALSEALLPEFDQEMATTRKVLERIPEDRLGWKPHPKSPTLGWLATHLTVLPYWMVVTIEQDSLDAAPAGGGSPLAQEATSRQEVLDLFDKNVAAARAALEGVSDEHLGKPWTLLAGGRTVFTLPRVATLRSFVISHMIHHRAQLGLYLRLNDVPVPAIYGPSADEAAF